MPELRFDPLRSEWVAYASDRNDRTFLPTDHCPLCPSGAGGDSEVPVAEIEVAVLENRFPAFGPDRVDGRPARPASTGCEVVVYTAQHELTLADLPRDRVKQLAGVEIGVGTFVNDTQPEATAAELRLGDQRTAAEGRI